MKSSFYVFVYLGLCLLDKDAKKNTLILQYESILFLSENVYIFSDKNCIVFVNFKG